MRKRLKGKRRLSSTSALKNGNNKQSELQSEYINNLQQQVYFLELELQIMKEKATTGQFGGRSSISKTAPIDTHVNSLRDKYTHMEKKFKKKMKTLEENVGELTNERDVLQLQLTRNQEENNELNEQLNYYKEIEDRLRSEHLGEKLALEQKLEKLQLRYNEKDQLYQDLRKDHQEFRESSRKKDLENQEKASEMRLQCERDKKSAEKSEEKAKESERLKLEAEEKIVQSKKQIDEMKKQESNLRDSVNEAENRYKKCAMDLDLAKSHSEKLEVQSKQLQSELDEAQSELQIIKQMEKQAQASEDRWSTHIVNLTSDNGILNSKLQFAQEDVERHKHEKMNLQEEMMRSKENIRELEEKIGVLEADLATSDKSVKALEEKNLELKKDHILQTNQADAAKAAQEQAEQQLEKVQATLDDVQSRHKSLQAQLSTQNALENINVEEVTRLSAHTKDINSSIQALLATIQKQVSMET